MDQYECQLMDEYGYIEFARTCETLAQAQQAAQEHAAQRTPGIVLHWDPWEDGEPEFGCNSQSAPYQSVRGTDIWYTTYPLA